MELLPTVESIHLAKATRLPMQPKTTVEVEAGKGIVGDRYHGTKHRHVTVQSRESLDEAATVYGRAVPSHLTRRNLTLSHGVVPREPGALLRIGDVLLEAVRVAAPCKLLDDTIGAGAQEALRRRAGTVFRVLEGGTITVGDAVVGVSSRAPRPA
ncbi:MOSC domain-containing protein [Nocardioides sp. CPCC 206347]|uniref:MOSC domain-containing protein n=1 Tax=unclassified Nocardioides TaxID=2615069 RepID=UPI0036193C2E